MPSQVPGKRKRGERNGTDRAEQTPPPEGIEQSQSVWERAQPYLLVVAKMPLDMLDTQWTVGRNRAVNPKHVRKLKEAFASVGIERSAPENRLRLICSAEEVRRMEAVHPKPWADGAAPFLDWAEHNDKVEVVAGQHRIRALQEYVRERRAPATELWGACGLCDRGTLRAVL
jgi:hypothetical protein